LNLKKEVVELGVRNLVEVLVEAYMSRESSQVK